MLFNIITPFQIATKKGVMIVATYSAFGLEPIAP